MRLKVVLVIAAALSAWACAGRHLSDSRLQTSVFVDDPRFQIRGKSVAVFPFELPSEGQPAAPQFGVFLRHAMLEDRQAQTVAYVPAPAWAAVPEWQYARWTEEDRIVATAREARGRGLDFAVIGRVETLYRSTRHAVRARVTVWLISAADEQVVWYGAKKANWVRPFPMDDSLLHLARSFVAEWYPPKR